MNVYPKSYSIFVTEAGKFSTGRAATEDILEVASSKTVASKNGLSQVKTDSLSSCCICLYSCTGQRGKMEAPDFRMNISIKVYITNGEV